MKYDTYSTSNLQRRGENSRVQSMSVAEFIDQKEFGGSLYEQIEEAMSFAKTHISKSGRIQGLQRIDTYDVPIEAIREALVNAVVHRDYSISGSDIKFAIFDNRIEITSPGALPKALEIKDIFAGRSEIRNRVIARFFKEIHFIEAWGTGIKRIIGACKNANLREPAFEENGLFFQLTIYKIIHEHSQKSSQKTTQKSSQKIFEIIKRNPQVTIKDLCMTAKLSDRTVKNYINQLKKEGAIQRIGPDKGGCWEILVKNG